MLKSETQQPEIIESDNTPSVEVISLDRKLSSAFCKICYSGGSCEQLIHPCFCKGSVGNIHLTCLERWINECGIDRCELCLFQFTSDQTRRYTVWQSLVIWTRNPVHRSLLISDSIVMVVITIVMACLITSVVMGMTVFSTSKSDSSMDIFGLCLAVAFITVTIIGYTLTVFMIIRDNIRPWYRWWKNCKDIRLNREELSNPQL